MAPNGSTFRPSVLLLTAVFGASMVSFPTRDASADEVSSTGKGVAGGALLGAEAVTIVEGIADVRPAWAYVVGGLVGAAGGGIGGYFVEQGSSDGRAPSYLLAGGLALVIPAVVMTLNGTRYRPERGSSEDRAPTGPSADPGAPGGGVVVSPAPAPAVPVSPPPPAVGPSMPPTSLLDIGGGKDSLSQGGAAGPQLRVGLPVPSVRPVYSLAQQRQYGMRSETEVHMPLLHVTF